MDTRKELARTMDRAVEGTVHLTRVTITQGRVAVVAALRGAKALGRADTWRSAGEAAGRAGRTVASKAEEAKGWSGDKLSSTKERTKSAMAEKKGERPVYGAVKTTLLIGAVATAEICTGGLIPVSALVGFGVGTAYARGRRFVPSLRPEIENTPRWEKAVRFTTSAIILGGSAVIAAMTAGVGAGLLVAAGSVGAMFGDRVVNGRDYNVTGAPPERHRGVDYARRSEIEKAQAEHKKAKENGHSPDGFLDSDIIPTVRPSGPDKLLPDDYAPVDPDDEKLHW